MFWEEGIPQVTQRALGVHPSGDAQAPTNRELGCNGWFPFVLKGENAIEGHMFGLMAHDSREFVFAGHQGRALRRDGVVHVRVAIEHGAPVNVTISGAAVVLFSAPLGALV